MINTEIIYNALQRPKINTIQCDSYCKICGKQILEGVKTKESLSGSFTNFNDCKRIESEYTCKECNYCLKDKKLRQNSFIASKDTIIFCKNNQLGDYIFKVNL